VDWGWLFFITKPFFYAIDWLNHFLGNFGLAIMAFTLVVKGLFFPLANKSYRSMSKMKLLGPKMTALREQYKDDKAKLQPAIMALYKAEKVNPAAGCLPIFIQIPVFIALYWVLLSSIEMRNAPWIGWIHDLSTPDPYFILPAVMTLSSLLQTALNPVPPDPMQAKMMWIMPLAFSVMFFFFPAGLVLYWITNNVLSIAQQWLINVRMGVPPEFNLPKFK
jgi:YidC/Oxa1 family membrane protein insertase